MSLASDKKNAFSLFFSKHEKLTEIQKSAFSPISRRENVLIVAPTGSGKTEAAVIPVFNNLIKSEQPKKIRAIYVTPLRALNRDLLSRLESIAKELGIVIGVRHGDTKPGERAKQAANPPSFMITTPETLQNIVLSERLRESLNALEVVIIDEVHELCYNKRGAQLSIMLERLRELSTNFQRIGISATVGNPELAANFLFGEIGGRIVELKGKKESIINIEMPQKAKKKHERFLEDFPMDKEALARLERIADLSRSSEGTLVFANTRQIVESLGSKLIRFDKEEPFGGIGIHHGSLDKEERIKTERAFREGKIKNIIATSSLELGIDIGRIDLVVQYGSPKQAVRLVQRIGRAGHSEGRSSVGKMIVGGEMELFEAAVIAERVKNGCIESQGVEENALDVLANQIAGIVMEYGKIEADKAFFIVKRSFNYRTLERSKFNEIIRLLSELHIVGEDNGIIKRGERTRQYFFSNISVIPNRARFLVRDLAKNKIIASLDEKFVFNYLEDGALFITRGVPWKVVSVDEKEIYVEPSQESGAAIPDWEGEDIPVAFEVAQRVFSAMGGNENALGMFVEKSTMERGAGFVRSQSKFFLPGNNKISVEYFGEHVVVHLAMGRLANEFLSKVIGMLIVSGGGQKVPIKATPYSIIIECGQLNKKPDMGKIFDVISRMDPGSFGDERIMLNSEIFRYKFAEISKLFGAIDKEATITKSALSRIVSFYKGTVIFEEAIRDLNKNYFDIKTVSEFMGRFRKGEIFFEAFESESPLAKEAIRSAYKYAELITLTRPDEREVEAFKNRVGKPGALLVCTFCGTGFRWQEEEKILCPNCGSPMVATHKDEYEHIIEKKKRGARISAKEWAEYKNMINEASLIEAYGSRAVMALKTYGVGVATAARVLAMVRKDDEKFIVDLMEAQRNFIKNRKFWKER